MIANSGFGEWLEEAKWLLPSTMTLAEARNLYERTLKERIEENIECHHQPSKDLDVQRCFKCGDLY